MVLWFGQTQGLTPFNIKRWVGLCVGPAGSCNKKGKGGLGYCFGLYNLRVRLFIKLGNHKDQLCN